jgi:hypothetical protein
VTAATAAIGPGAVPAGRRWNWNSCRRWCLSCTVLTSDRPAPCHGANLNLDAMMRHGS